MRYWMGIVLAVTAFGQQREIGGDFGYGFYRYGDPEFDYE
jgi:hypothetical protein